MNIKNYFLTGGIIFILTCCSQQDSISDTRKVEITEEIKVLMDGYPEAVKRHDLDWFSKFWSNEKDFVFAVDGQVITNYDEWFKMYYSDGLKNLKEILHFDWSNGHATIFSENTVSYATNFDWGMVAVSGDTVKVRGSALYVFKKSDGEWRAVNCGATHTYYK